MTLENVCTGVLVVKFPTLTVVPWADSVEAAGKGVPVVGKAATVVEKGAPVVDKGAPVVGKGAPVVGKGAGPVDVSKWVSCWVGEVLAACEDCGYMNENVTMECKCHEITNKQTDGRNF